MPRALALRLQALRENPASWHDWWQAGVLLSELAESARRVRYRDGWTDDVQQLVKLADQFFCRALQERTHNPKLLHRTLDQCAINSDRALAFARCAHPPLVAAYSAKTPIGMLKDVIGKLNSDCLHQIAIAHGFMARVHWWEFFATGDVHHLNDAYRHGEEATHLFRQNLADAPRDKKRAIAGAFASHLIVMALARSRCRSHAGRWMACLQARSLAHAYGDHRQEIRTFVVAIFGNKGERWLRKRRDRPAAIKAAISEAKTLLAENA